MATTPTTAILFKQLIQVIIAMPLSVFITAAVTLMRVVKWQSQKEEASIFKLPVRY